MREIAKKFDHDAKTISTQRVTVVRQAGATCDIERVELKHTVTTP